MIPSGKSGRDVARSLKPRPTELLAMLTDARVQAGLTQREMAKLMYTHRSVIERLENGRRNNPTVATLEKWAEITGKRLEIRFI